MDILRCMQLEKIVPVVVLDHADKAVQTAQALAAGGLHTMEITMRTHAALDAICMVKQNCPDTIVGAGTVVTLEQCREVVERGASFVVSPGFQENIVEWCLSRKIPVLPGCVTASEIIRALQYGLKILKFFPAEACGGIGMLKALSAAFPGVSFLPTGGINASNLQNYLMQPCVAAVGGSWLCRRSDINNNEFRNITVLSKAARQIVSGGAA